MKSRNWKLSKSSKRKIAMMAITFCSAATAVHAQQTPSQNATPNGAPIEPPTPISQIVSIDAHNSVLVESAEPKEYSLAVPRHIYSGAVARVFGGTIIPTENFVIPQSAMRGNGNTNMGAPGNFGTFPGFSGPNGAPNNFGNNFNNFGNSGNFGNNLGNFTGGFPGATNYGGFGRFNNFQRYAPRVQVNDMNQFNKVLGFLDKPIPQAQVGANFSDATSTANNGFGVRY